MGSARQQRVKPAAGGRINVAVVDVGKLLLLAPLCRPEVLLSTESDRDETPLLCSASDRQSRAS
jgi:hypothetical protein